ncbi:MAG: hypothetical protein NTY38_21810 [Acidobacteria bacterium]|nr:hypothetical protein [Acidobacteriota bacterium]
MRCRGRVRRLLLLVAALNLGVGYGYQIVGDDRGSWPAILASTGLLPAWDPAGLVIIPAGEAAAPEVWLPKIEAGAVVVLEGESRLAGTLGISPTKQRLVVRGITDRRRPGLKIIWQKPLDLNVFRLPKEARLFAWERWERAPVMAGIKRGKGAVLWLATSPGPQGFERYPYLLQALADMGVRPPFHSRRLWTFFDSSYRLRADPDYLAAHWQQAGIAALHVAAWHYWEPDATRDAYLERLIAACHRQAIVVYAWLELPHVSERFWNDHPPWREKTALQQDAHLDWRKLMNLQNPDCAGAVAMGARELVTRFDWDGINLAELYFESLEGAANAARFTPMNTDVREAFRAQAGFDPLELFTGPRDEKKLRLFLDYRADLIRRMQAGWLGEVEKLRAAKRHLDIVLTHVDDRFDTRMRDLIGADAASTLPLLSRHDFTFLIEDPATVWHLGPKRYAEIRKRYLPLTDRQEKMAIDINIVERYQDVYPTRQQTGLELFQLVRVAATAFPRVALYFENSILPPDLPLLSSAAAGITRAERIGAKLVIESANGAGIPWDGCALVDGRTWAAQAGGRVWIPGGTHVLEPGACPASRLVELNGDLQNATATSGSVDFSYRSQARALAVLERKPLEIEIDGQAVKCEVTEGPRGFVVSLPRGQHLVSVKL